MNHRHLLLSASVALACVAYASGAAAQTAAQSSNPNQPEAGAARAVDGAEGQASRLQRADKSFLDDAAHSGHAEVKSSQLALTKAQNPKVRAFAQQMVDDHTKANQELAALAASKNVRVPEGPSLVQEGKIKLLGTADGADFDKRYMESMGLQAHRDTVALFEKGARDARDPDVKAFAQKTLPKLKHHLEMAQQLAQEVGVSADKAAAGGK